MVSAFLGDAPAGGATGGGGKKHGGGAVEWTGEAAKGQADKWVGAVDVGELTLSDWQSCAAFASARPLEQRRLLSNLPVPPQF